MNIDLSKMNLNLLVALDALLKERHVTQAGKRLHISQSAMSNLLRQLRELFKDELFVRGQASRLTPTPYALALKPQIREALNNVEAIFQKPKAFNPKIDKRTFTIGLSDYTEFVLLPHLLKKLSCISSPHLELVIKHLNYFDAKNLSEIEELDLAIGIYRDVPENLISHTLFTDRAVCVGDKKHPLLKKIITWNQLAQARHLVVLYFENRAQLGSEQYLRQLGLKRHVVVTVPHTLAALYSLPHTDLITAVFERIAKPVVKSLGLTYQPIDWGKVKRPAEIQMVWHPRHRNDPAHQWLRQTVTHIGEKLATQ